MKLSFVIPAYNEEAFLPKCLDSIIKYSKGKDYDIEIIVVNNASTDGTRAAAERYPEVTIVDEKRKGLVWARHAGFIASHGDLIANVDADTMLTPHWIERVFAEFKKNEKLVALSGPFIYYDLPMVTRFFVRIFYLASYLTYLVNHFIFRASSVLQGGNFIVRRAALLEIGGFDTTISFYGEDTDIARRMSKVGKVKFTFRLSIFSSGRRLAKEGVLTAGLRYFLNYWWITLFKRPLSKEYNDLRPREDGVVLAYEPESRIKEWLIGTGVICVTGLILLGMAYGAYRIIQSGVIGAIGFVEFQNKASQEAQKIKAELSGLSSSTKNMIKEKLNEPGQ